MIRHIDIFLASFCLIVICLIANNYEKILTEEIYVLNTYLYILLAIIIVVSSWSILDKYPTTVDRLFLSPWNFTGIIIISFVALFCAMLIPTQNVTTKHVAWVTFVTTIGLMTYVTYLQSIETGNLEHVGIVLVILVGILSWISYSKPLGFFDSYAKPLLTMLTTLIIIELGDLLLFSGNTEAFLTRSRVYSWIAIVTFSGLLIYDMQKIRKNAITVVEECRGKKQLGCVDYCKESLSVFLGITNLFNGLSNA